MNQRALADPPSSRERTAAENGQAAPKPRTPQGPSDGDRDAAMSVRIRTAVVVFGYLAYVALVFGLPTHDLAEEDVLAADQARLTVRREAYARRAWLRAGCPSCHSLYGLGGHTGPDLTNVSSRVPDAYIEQVVRNGLGAMPPIKVEDEQLWAITAYLRSVNETGVYPPARTDAPLFGETR